MLSTRKSPSRSLSELGRPELLAGAKHRLLVNMWREALADAFKGISQSMKKGLKAGSGATTSNLWVEGLPYPRPCREIPSSSTIGQVASQLYAPVGSTTPRSPSLNASKVSGIPWSALSDQMTRVNWITMQSHRQCRGAEIRKLPIWAVRFCWASRLTCSGVPVQPSIQGSPGFCCGAQPVAHFSHRKSFQLKQDLGQCTSSKLFPSIQDSF